MGHLDEEGFLVLDEDERIGHFYRGTIRNLHRSPERGVIHTVSGRRIPFVMSYVRFSGRPITFRDLYDGQQVGYDLTWTSRGRRISAIHVPATGE